MDHSILRRVTTIVAVLATPVNVLSLLQIIERNLLQRIHSADRFKDSTVSYYKSLVGRITDMITFFLVSVIFVVIPIGRLRRYPGPEAQAGDLVWDDDATSPQLPTVARLQEAVGTVPEALVETNPASPERTTLLFLNMQKPQFHSSGSINHLRYVERIYHPLEDHNLNIPSTAGSSVPIASMDEQRQRFKSNAAVKREVQQRLRRNIFTRIDPALSFRTAAEVRRICVELGIPIMKNVQKVSKGIQLSGGNPEAQSRENELPPQSPGAVVESGVRQANRQPSNARWNSIDTIREDSRGTASSTRGTSSKTSASGDEIPATEETGGEAPNDGNSSKEGPRDEKRYSSPSSPGSTEKEPLYNWDVIIRDLARESNPSHQNPGNTEPTIHGSAEKLISLSSGSSSHCSSSNRDNEGEEEKEERDLINSTLRWEKCLQVHGLRKAMKDLRTWDPRGWDAIMKSLKTEDAIPLRPPARRDGSDAKFEATIAYRMALVEQGKSALAVPIRVNDPWTMEDFDMPYDGEEEVLEEEEVLTHREEDENHRGTNDELEVISFVGMDPATRKIVSQMLLEEGPRYVEAVAKALRRVEVAKATKVTEEES